MAPQSSPRQSPGGGRVSASEDDRGGCFPRGVTAPVPALSSLPEEVAIGGPECSLYGGRLSGVTWGKDPDASNALPLKAAEGDREDGACHVS
ncbi:unnamed protein product [Arctogadus glacialis]